MSNRGKHHLHVISFGLAVGVTWALGIFILGIVNIFFSTWGVDFISSIGSVYVGYEPTILGSILGGIWAFIDGFIGGVILAWLYNQFSGCCGKCNKESE